MQNDYSESEIALILASVGSSCRQHKQRDVSVASGPFGLPHCTCLGGPHDFSVEYHVALKKGITVRAAVAFLGALLGRSDLVYHEHDFRWFSGPCVEFPWDGFVRTDDYWSTRGLLPETLETFGVGALNGTPAIPARMLDGRCYGFLLRDPDLPPNASAPPETRWWKLPKTDSFPAWSGRNLLRPPYLPTPEDPFIVVVEGAVDAMRCVEAGFYGVSLTSSSISYPQIAELREISLNRRIVMFTDDDYFGQRIQLGAPYIKALLPFFEVQQVLPVGGHDAGDLSTEAVRSILSGVRFPVAP